MTEEHYARKIYSFIKSEKFLEKEESLSFIKVISILDKVKSLLYKEKIIPGLSESSQTTE